MRTINAILQVLATGYFDIKVNGWKHSAIYVDIKTNQVYSIWTRPGSNNQLAFLQNNNTFTFDSVQKRGLHVN